MINNTLLDKEGNTLSAHITKDDRAVITISGSEDDTCDIDFLIKELRKIKKNFPESSLDKAIKNNQ